MTEWNRDDPDATNVHYDLAKWSFEQQAELAAVLADAEVPHAWDHSELIVPEEQEQAVDVLIETVQERLGIVDTDAELDIDDETDGVAAAFEPIVLADGVEATEYGLDEWSDADREVLTRALTRAQIPFRWEDDVVLVPTESETEVETLLDQVENGEYVDLQVDLGADDDAPSSEVLTWFFLAGERLRRDPLDPDGLEQLLNANDVADRRTVPYGVEPRLWMQVCDLAEELTEALVDSTTPDEDAAMNSAGRLHDLLRPFV